MKRFFEQISYSPPEKSLGSAYRVFLFILSLFSILYGILIKFRFFLYGAGLFKTKRLDCMVISVGNLTVGGTGKTPTVEFIAGHLRDRGYKAAVVSRGYKGKKKGDINIVSDGRELFMSPEDAGDEPYMLARKLKGVPVLVGVDRYKVGKYAVDSLLSDIVILDDGFQYLRLARDMDILLIDGEKGFGNGRLAPAGPLREPLSGIRRAGVLMVSKASDDMPELVKALLSTSSVPVFKGCYRAKRLAPLRKGEGIGLERLSGARVMAVSGIASPSSFLRLVSSLGGIVVCEESLPDHYSYTLDDLERLANNARANAAEFIVTTEKDAVKLERLNVREDIPVYYLEIGMDMHGDEQRFVDSLIPANRA